MAAHPAAQVVSLAGRVRGAWAASGIAGVLLPAGLPRTGAGGLRRVRLLLPAAGLSRPLAAVRAHPAVGPIPVRRRAVPGQSANRGAVSAVVAVRPRTGSGRVRG